jgi:hypothetical protein
MNMARHKQTSFNKNDPVPMQHINSFDELMDSIDRIEVRLNSIILLFVPILHLTRTPVAV